MATRLKILTLLLALFPAIASAQFYNYFPPPGLTYGYNASIAALTAAATTNSLGFYSFGGANTLPFLKASPTTTDLVLCAGTPAFGTGVNGNNCNATMVLGKSGDWGFASSAGAPTYFFQSLYNNTAGFFGLLNDQGKGFSESVQGSLQTASPFEVTPAALTCPCQWFGNVGSTHPSSDLPNVTVALDGNQAPGLNGVFGAYLDASGYGHVWGSIDALFWVQCDDPAFAFTCTIGDNTQANSVTNIVGGSPANTRANNVPIATVSGATVSGHLAKFSNATGTVVDAGALTGSVTLTVTGMSTATTTVGDWTHIGGVACVLVHSALNTSNSTSMTMTGLPASLNSARTQVEDVPFDAVENTGSLPGTGVTITLAAASSVLTFNINGSPTGFTATGTKGVATPFTFCYGLT